MGVVTLIYYAKLNCEDCPAQTLKSLQHIKKIESLRLEALKDIDNEPRVILLLESTPANRFIYDLDSVYVNSGLRYNLRKEFKVESENQLFEFMNKYKIWIVDVALCPLHKLDKKALRRKAATICLSRHTKVYLETFEKARIIAIFPSSCGFLKNKIPNIQQRIQKQFRFNDFEGLTDWVR